MSPPLLRRRVRESKEGTYDRSFERGARWLLERGVHPNHFTFLQLPVFLVEIEAALHASSANEPVWRWIFALSTILVIVLDGGDGILARVGKLESKSGAVLDAMFDTLGIAIILWGASQFATADHPELARLYTQWLMFLFFANIVLFLQNALLEEKVIGYLRGPVVMGVAIPELLVGGLAVPSVVIGFLVVWRTPATLRVLAKRVPLP
ncbi:MAG: CDP-alcohol phosphatidyltransferase family protein [bacterium]